MRKAEPVLLFALLAAVLATLAVRISYGRYMATSMTVLDCRLGYWGLLSLSSYMHPATMEESAEWIAITVPDGHFLFSKPAAAGHPMAVRRRLETSGGRADVVTEGCAFGDLGAFKEAMTKLPPAVKVAAEEAGRLQLKAVLN